MSSEHVYLYDIALSDGKVISFQTKREIFELLRQIKTEDWIYDDCGKFLNCDAIVAISPGKN